MFIIMLVFKLFASDVVSWRPVLNVKNRIKCWGDAFHRRAIALYYHALHRETVATHFCTLLRVMMTVPTASACVLWKQARILWKITNTDDHSSLLNWLPVVILAERELKTKLAVSR